NRPDLWGHYGIAREISALYNLPLKKLEPYSAPANAEDFPIDIKDIDRCPRYIGARIEGVSVKASPFEMQSRIWRVGMRPINALVDVTNYVMLALGQPTHVFDSDNISDGITVRRANEIEELLLLNGKSLVLSTDDLVIADSESAVALAGVMGGAKDSVLPTTEKIILEVANFESTGVRRTALRYDNRTEASSRYEKAVDPERCDLALSMTMQLFSELYPEMRVTAFTDKYEKKLVQKEIDVEITWLERRLGKKISNEDVKAKLGLLGFEVSFTDTNMHITVPTWRSTGDVGIKADIMEEVARMYGYENFEPTPIVTSFEGAIKQLEVDLLRKIKEYLAIRCNMQEIFTYPWMQDELVEAIIGDTKGILKLSTPPSPTESYIRSTLLPNICGAVAKNERYYGEFSIFEEAQIFKDENYTSPYDSRELLPTQERHIAGAVAGDANKVKELFLRAKGIVENMSRYTHMESLSFRREEKPSWADSTVWLNIYLGEEKIGDLALLSKKASLACGIKNLATMLFEINADALKPFRSRTNSYQRINEYPLIEYDASMLFSVDVKWADIKATALKKKNNESFLKDVDFVDEYKGAQVPEGMKSVTIRLTISSNEKTLNADEIEACANSVLKVLSKDLGGE
ncbi:MAG: phenylalanine--tRNA ligase subunit beta, partial [Clostridia bacterium]|nr:phenylalanine--tRNA ligase subunit beta [Clostridia bacterium]